jgi:hypothetical protein
MALQDLNYGVDRKTVALGAAVSAPIAEGEEASCLFSATAISSSSSKQNTGLQKMMGLGRIAERAPPLPPTPENASNNSND